MKDCPQCRKHIPSRRSLRYAELGVGPETVQFYNSSFFARPDPNLDQLIAKIYPNLDE
jgi:hypothetical protein